MTPLFGELALRGWFPGWLALLMGAAAVGSIVLLYRREAGRVSVKARVLMAGLRAVTLATILFLVMRPSWLTETNGERPKAIALLVDDSESMKTRDPRLNFPDKWRTAVAMCVVGGRTGRGARDRPRWWAWPCSRSTRLKLDSLAR